MLHEAQILHCCITLESLESTLVRYSDLERCNVTEINKLTTLQRKYKIQSNSQKPVVLHKHANTILFI